jgi:hypothetical protein
MGCAQDKLNQAIHIRRRDGGLCDRKDNFPRNERYVEDMSRKQTTLHKIVVVQRLMGLNLKH